MPQRFDLVARLLLGVMTLGWLLAPLHFTDGEHHWCPEHDQFEHSEDEQRGATPTSVPNVSHKVAAFQTERANAAASGEHEACQVLGSIHRPKAALCDDSAQATYWPVADGRVVSTRHDFYSSGLLLAMAPKHGPPA